MPTNGYSFIVRVWREALDEQRGIYTWRGSIDDVGSGKRLYFQDVKAIPYFIQACTQASNQELGTVRKRLFAQLRRWLASRIAGDDTAPSRHWRQG